MLIFSACSVDLNKLSDLVKNGVIKTEYTELFNSTNNSIVVLLILVI